MNKFSIKTKTFYEYDLQHDNDVFVHSTDGSEAFSLHSNGIVNDKYIP